MPRIARIIAPGYAHHVTQRGNNHAPVFFDDEDRLTYLKLLSGYAEKYKLRIWAWCLMDNHVHLLVVPESETSLARGIGLTNMVYTQYFNRKRGQSGRIWQNRFFSCVVESNESSARAHINDTIDERLVLGSWLDPSEREAYAAFVIAEDLEQNNRIRKATCAGRPFGTEGFVDTLEYELNRTVRAQKVGRPRRDS
jgi:putative transposase